MCIQLGRGDTPQQLLGLILHAPLVVLPCPIKTSYNLQRSLQRRRDRLGHLVGEPPLYQPLHHCHALIHLHQRPAHAHALHQRRPLGRLEALGGQVFHGHLSGARKALVEGLTALDEHQDRPQSIQVGEEGVQGPVHDVGVLITDRAREQLQTRRSVKSQVTLQHISCGGMGARLVHDEVERSGTNAPVAVGNSAIERPARALLEQRLVLWIRCRSHPRSISARTDFYRRISDFHSRDLEREAFLSL